MRTSKRIVVWSRPQNSAQIPSFGYSPVSPVMSTWNVSTWPGNMSRLYRKPGIQKEWMTSIDVTSNCTAGAGRQDELGLLELGADDGDTGRRGS